MGGRQGEGVGGMASARGQRLQERRPTIALVSLEDISFGCSSSVIPASLMQAHVFLIRLHAVLLTHALFL